MGLPDQEGATYKQLLLNMDVASTAFYQEGPLVRVVLDFLGVSSISELKPASSSSSQAGGGGILSSYNILRLEKFLRGVNIEITYRSTGKGACVAGNFSIIWV